MRLALAPLAVAATLLACGLGGDGDGGVRPTGPGAAANDVEPAELAGTLAAHDAARAAVGVAPLAWDGELARTAAAWAARCVDEAAPAGLLDHNPGRSDGYPTYVGENIYASTGDASGPAAVAAWVAEAAHYHHETNACDAGAVCGHYTQVVWRSTEHVGCAKRVCPSLRYPSTIVCNYAPGGNVSGQRPY